MFGKKPVFLLWLSLTLTLRSHSEHFSHQTGGSHTRNSTTPPAGCPPTWRCHQIRRLRAQSHQTAPLLPMLITNSRPPIYPQLLFSMATNRKFPWPPPSWIWLCGRIARRTEGNISSYLPVCYKIWSWLRMNSQGLRGKVSSAGASVAVELGCIILHEQGCVHQPESSLNAMLLEFWWRLHHVGMVNYYLHF